jgi:hypothetical protein
VLNTNVLVQFGLNNGGGCRDLLPWACAVQHGTFWGEVILQVAYTRLSPQPTTAHLFEFITLQYEGPAQSQMHTRVLELLRTKMYTACVCLDLTYSPCRSVPPNGQKKILLACDLQIC